MGGLRAGGWVGWAALRRHVNADGECWPSWGRIAILARCKRTKVSEAVGELERYGYLTRNPRVGQSSVYTLMVPVRVADGPVRSADAPPVRVADPEVSPEEKKLQEEHAVATAPARNGKRDKAWKEAGGLFVALSRDRESTRLKSSP